MKTKVLALIVMSALAMSSCKKEELVKPSTDLRVEKVADKSDAAGWD